MLKAMTLKTRRKTPESEKVTTQAEADRLVAIARNNPHQILSTEGKLQRQSPLPPFITSTLQQSAGAKLRFTPDQTMKVAQSLYESRPHHLHAYRLGCPLCALLRCG